MDYKEQLNKLEQFARFLCSFEMSLKSSPALLLTSNLLLQPAASNPYLMSVEALKIL